MTDHVYKLIEVTGSSGSSMQAAIENAVARASKSVHNMRWLQVTETRGHIEGDQVSHWQVTVKIGFTLDD